jgi:hypothetical protein
MSTAVHCVQSTVLQHVLIPISCLSFSSTEEEKCHTIFAACSSADRFKLYPILEEELGGPPGRPAYHHQKPSRSALPPQWQQTLKGQSHEIFRVIL